MIVREEIGVRKYLESRNILMQYQKAKQNIIEGRFSQVQLKKRKPETLAVFQFRITQKYRALGYFFRSDIFIVIEISDHQ